MNKKPTQDEIEVWKQKAKKWDALEAKINECYFDEDGNKLEDEDGGADLGTIGEYAAMAFGFL